MVLSHYSTCTHTYSKAPKSQVQSVYACLSNAYMPRMRAIVAGRNPSLTKSQYKLDYPLSSVPAGAMKADTGTSSTCATTCTCT